MTASGRVLHVMRMTGVGGAENHLRALLPELRERGWGCDLLIPSPRPEAISAPVARFRPLCDRVTVVRTPLDASPRLLARLAREMRSGRYDLVHTHLVHADWHGAVASAAAPGVALVTSKHNEDPFRRMRAFNLLERPLTNRSSAVIAISDAVRDFTLRWARPKPPVVTVLYGLEDGAAARRSEDPEPLLLTVARLVEQKGLDVLIEAMSDVVEAVPEARLLVAGEGPARPQLEDMIRIRGLEGRIELAGHRDDVPQLMRRAWLLVHPARWEGFGLIYLEAMRERLSVVGTAVGPVPEIVLDGETGTLTPPDDAEALTHAIVRALRDPAFLRRTGEAGHARLRERFTAARMADETIAVYRRALQNGRPVQ